MSNNIVSAFSYDIYHGHEAHRVPVGDYVAIMGAASYDVSIAGTVPATNPAPPQ